MQYGLGPNANIQTASVTPIAIAPAHNNAGASYGNALNAEMAKKKSARAKGCRRVRGGGCLCNGRFAKKSRCRR